MGSFAQVHSRAFTGGSGTLLCQLSTDPGVGPDLRECVPAPACVDAVRAGGSLLRWMWVPAAQAHRYEQAWAAASDVKNESDDGAWLISR